MIDGRSSSTDGLSCINRQHGTFYFALSHNLLLTAWLWLVPAIGDEIGALVSLDKVGLREFRSPRQAAAPSRQSLLFVGEGVGQAIAGSPWRQTLRTCGAQVRIPSKRHEFE